MEYERCVSVCVCVRVYVWKYDDKIYSVFFMRDAANACLSVYVHMTVYKYTKMK